MSSTIPIKTRRAQPIDSVPVPPPAHPVLPQAPPPAEDVSSGGVVEEVEAVSDSSSTSSSDPPAVTQSAAKHMGGRPKGSKNLRSSTAGLDGPKQLSWKAGHGRL
jgi:hypothetical protein